jgi:ubiquinone biosynthesis protein
MSTPGAYLRLVRAGWVMTREGVVAALPGDELTGLPRTGWRVARCWPDGGEGPRPRAAKAVPTRVTRLGPSYVKLGQFLATRPTSSAPTSRSISPGCRTDADLSARAGGAADRGLARPAGRRRSFCRFGEPVAAASIAQVHPAEVAARSGTRKVAVKVIRPGVRSASTATSKAISSPRACRSAYIPATRRLRPVEVTKTLAQTTKIEMDLRLEAAALSELGENTADDPGFRVPAVDWERTGRDVLTMEWIDGIKLSTSRPARRRPRPRRARRNADAVLPAAHAARRLLPRRHASGQSVRGADGTIVAVDFGITGRLGKKERRFLAEILYGFITRDYRRVADVHFEAGYVPRTHDVASFAQAIRAIGEPIHGQPAETISMARLLTLLFEVTELFDMATRPELVMLQKTMVVVEGVARTLNPSFNMWKTAEPVVGDWIRDNLGPRGMLVDAREGINALVSLARQAPDLAKRTERLSREIDAMAEHGLRFDDETARHRQGRSRAIRAGAASRYGDRRAGAGLDRVAGDVTALTAMLRHAELEVVPLRQSASCSIIGGGIAAYKSLDLIRRLRERGARVRCVMTPPRSNS